MKEMKECPFCNEEIKSMATVCRYCHEDLNSTAKDNQGRFVKVRVKNGEKIYLGDIFVPENYRVSDIINNDKRFIVLSNAIDVRQTRDIYIGFLAINKTRAEWIELSTPQESMSTDSSIKPIEQAA